MKITVVSMVYPPETGPARLMGQCVEQFLKNGHTVEVLTTFPSYPVGTVYPGYKKRFLQTERVSESLTIRRLWSFTSAKRDNMKYRVLQFLTFGMMTFFFALFCRRPDIWYVPAYPYFQPISIGFVRWIRGGKLFVRIQDSWPEAPIEMGYVHSPWLKRFLLWTERKCYAAADWISTLSPEMVEHLIQRGAPADKISAIYNWVDYNAFKPSDDDELRRKLNIKNRFVILYAGNIGEPQGLRIVLEAGEKIQNYIVEQKQLIKESKETDNERSKVWDNNLTEIEGTISKLEKVVFVLIGYGGERKLLANEVQERNIQNVRFLEPVSETEIFDYFNMADALLVHLKKMSQHFGAIPSKTQVYMSTGKPLIAGALGAIERLVQDSKCGLFFEPESSDALMDATLKMIGFSNEERQQLGQNGVEYARSHFDMEAQCKKTDELLRQLAQKS
ncbi:MAG: glycosyltransferase family 4 protein [Planctomycetia bacterium]|nr:glycosyltransferase family 4 protein [Planctomycetia bacterium]